MLPDWIWFGVTDARSTVFPGPAEPEPALLLQSALKGHRPALPRSTSRPWRGPERGSKTTTTVGRTPQGGRVTIVHIVSRMVGFGQVRIERSFHAAVDDRLSGPDPFRRRTRGQRNGRLGRFDHEGDQGGLSQDNRFRDDPCSGTHSGKCGGEEVAAPVRAPRKPTGARHGSSGQGLGKLSQSHDRAGRE